MGESLPLLEVKNLIVNYGGIAAVRDLSLTVGRGEIVALIGANGAGKTSTLQAIAGTVPYQGIITFDGENLQSLPPDEIVSRGLALVPEGRQIFGNLTVGENLRLATWPTRGKPNYDYIFNLFPRLAERRQQLGGDSLWWRATNAGHCSGVNDQSFTLFARRAFAGPVTPAGTGVV